MNSRLRTALARAVSIVAHPALLLPAVALAALASSDRSGPTLAAALALCIVLAGSVVAYAWRQVAKGRWSHIDAIAPVERRDHNRLAALVLVVGAALTLMSGREPLVGLGLACGALIIAFAALVSAWLKPSEHVAFGAFAAVIGGLIDPALILAGAVLTMAVAWSRLELNRHTPLEAVVGGAVGLVAGVGLLLASAL